MKKRPAMPSNIPESLQQIIADCWGPDPVGRPTMDRVVDRMERALTDIAIQDEDARRFWNEEFAGKSRVRFDKFQAALDKFLKVNPAEVDEADKAIR